MLRVQPSKLETLDDLLAQAEHYANYSMRDLALTMLKVKGVGRATPGAIPRLHRNRR